MTGYEHFMLLICFIESVTSLALFLSTVHIISKLEKEEKKEQERKRKDLEKEAME